MLGKCQFGTQKYKLLLNITRNYIKSGFNFPIGDVTTLVVVLRGYHKKFQRDRI